MRRGDEVSDQVLGRRGRDQKIADNLQVKEVVLGEGERRKRYIVCRNLHEAKHQRERRERQLAKLQAELESLTDLGTDAHSKRVCHLVSSRRYGR